MAWIVLKICLTSSITAVLLVFVVGYFQAPVPDENPAVSGDSLRAIIDEVAAESVARGEREQRDPEQARHPLYEEVQALLNKLRAEQAAVNITTNARPDPELAAAANRMFRDSGIPAEMLQRNPDLRRDIEAQDAVRTLEQNPNLVNWAMNPRHAELAPTRQDLEGLLNVTKKLKEQPCSR